MLAIVQSVLLRPVDLPQPGRLVQIYAEDETKGFSATPRAISYPAIDTLRRDMRSLAGVNGYNTMVLPVEAADGAGVNPLMEVTPGFFQMLGVSPKFGRLIGPDDAKAQVADVSDDFWRDRLQKNPRAIGTAITISGRQWTVVGVLPAGFHAPGMTGASVVFLPISVGSSGEDEFKIEWQRSLAI
jgi:MacB-like periplasmic core domain